MKLLQILALLLVSSSSMAIMVPTEYLNPERITQNQLPEDMASIFTSAPVRNIHTENYQTTYGSTSGYHIYEVQTQRADSLELWSVDIGFPYFPNPGYLDLIALGETTYDPSTGLYTHLIEGFLDPIYPEAGSYQEFGWAIQLASGDDFNLTYLNPNTWFDASFPLLLRPEGAETLNTWRDRNFAVSEPATMVLFMLSLVGAVGFRKKIKK